MATLAESAVVREADASGAIYKAVWPTFMRQDPVADAHWDQLIREFPEYQFGLLDAKSGALLALGNSIPLVWSDHLANLPARGWDWAFEQGCADRDAGRTPTMLCALSIAIWPEHQGKGLSQHAVRAMKQIAVNNDLDGLIAPVRPSQKAQYPLTSIARYVQWQRPDGLPFDAWLRVHVRLGASIIKVCAESMRIPGTVAQWEHWSGMAFPDSGPYVVPSALVPVDVDREQNAVVYVEPNVWMHHPIR
ncbi:MAG: GNAT family N-acetyltransferase [Anaerolineae bacterium]|nr:GNAT family N-acetyltransferase [Anaerolineae bacterium]